MTQDMNDLIAELSDLRLPELKERYREATGQETRCPNKTYLIRSICSALKEAPNDAGEPEEPIALADADVEALDDEDDASEPAIERNAERDPSRRSHHDGRRRAGWTGGPWLGDVRRKRPTRRTSANRDARTAPAPRALLVDDGRGTAGEVPRGRRSRHGVG